MPVNIVAAAMTTTAPIACRHSRVPATIVNPVLPEIPQRVLDASLKHATVSLSVWLDASGKLRSASTSKSSGSADFDSLAQSLAWHSKFEPELRACKPVSGSYTLDVDFSLTPDDPKKGGGANLKTHAQLVGERCPADHEVMLAQNTESPPVTLHSERSSTESRTAIVLVDVDSSGSITRTSIAVSTGSAALDGAALSLSRSATYVPAVSGCQNIAGTFRYAVTFARNRERARADRW